MNIISYFSEAGVPKTGLTPSITIVKTDGTVIINAQSMSAITNASGFYLYDFTTYDEDLDYCISVDGGSSLTDQDRYLASTNETAGIGNLLQIEKGNWKISGNQMKFYDTDGTTALYTFNLKNKEGTPTETDVFSRTGA